MQFLATYSSHCFLHYRIPHTSLGLGGEAAALNPAVDTVAVSPQQMAAGRNEGSTLGKLLICDC
jgi:hypothetical protein